MGKDLTSENPIKLLLFLSLPLLIGLMGQQIYIILDTIIVSKMCGQTGLATISSITPLINIPIAIYSGICLAIGVVISQIYGAKKKVELRQAITTSMITAIILAVVITIIGIASVDGLLKVIGMPKDLYDDAKLFFLIYVVGFTFRLTFGVNDAIFIAMGDSKGNLIFSVIGNIVNVFLDILLLTFLKQGVIAASAATVFATIVMSFMSYKRLFNFFEKLKISIFVKNGVFKLEYFFRIIKLSIPAMLMHGIIVVGSIIVQTQINKFDTSVISAYGVVSKIEVLSVVFNVAMMQAIVSFTGQNIGACKVNRIKNGFKEATICGTIITSVVSAIVYIFAKEIIQIFMGTNVTEETLNMATSNLKFCAPFFVLYSVMNNAQGIFRGSSDMVSAISSMLAMQTTKVLTIFFLLNEIGVVAIWISIPASLVAGAIYSYAIYKMEFWRHLCIEKPADLEEKITYQKELA